MKTLFLAIILCVLASCRGAYSPDTNEETEKLMYSLRVVVDYRFSPPLCFLANGYYGHGYRGGPILATIPCSNFEKFSDKFPDKVVIGCENCWNR